MLFLFHKIIYKLSSSYTHTFIKRICTFQAKNPLFSEGGSLALHDSVVSRSEPLYGLRPSRGALAMTARRTQRASALLEA